MASSPVNLAMRRFDVHRRFLPRLRLTHPHTLPRPQWGTSAGSFPNVVTGGHASYTYGKYTSGVIHTTKLTGLPLGTRIFYRCGDAATGYSAAASFVSNIAGPTYPYTLGVLADVGESDAANSTISHLLDADSLSVIDSVIISGDISYASGCESSGCTVWDAWGRMIAPLSSTQPFMINIGNHELYDDANGIPAISAQYRYAGMPSDGRKDGALYFSWNSGPVHFISVCSFNPAGFSTSTPLMVWLSGDLAAVDRSVTPWIAVSVHAPWYNSNTEHQGDGEPARVAMEAMFIAAGVSVVFSGHVHAYERSYPVNNNKVVAMGPGSMTHFNIGDGGADLYTGWEKTPAWSAVHSATWGHGRWAVLNGTHSLFTWHQNSGPESKISDSVYVMNGSPQAY
jgi:hypothetical protein